MASGIAGLVFNSMSAVDFLMTQTQNESYMDRFSAQQLEVLYGFPAWFVVFWALAVWCGALGSLLGIIVTALHNFSSANGLYETGGTAPGFILLIFVVVLSLWPYARAMSERGVLA